MFRLARVARSSPLTRSIQTQASSSSRAGARGFGRYWFGAGVGTAAAVGVGLGGDGGKPKKMDKVELQDALRETWLAGKDKDESSSAAASIRAEKLREEERRANSHLRPQLKPAADAPAALVSEAEADAANQGAYNPETGEINWDCPCLGGMAHGPCGEEFRAAFSCFIYSEDEPKGMDCVEKFQGMQTCFRAHPEVYAEEIADDEAAEAALAAELKGTKSEPSPAPNPASPAEEPSGSEQS
uniref:Mitochondrial intermembrane space import and assembly protein 40 n=1 Tax=Mycena chlorophos TaxID=658473 RepID=A0ABQ0MB22_MYCCL|nr:predicted protein [Mycena chlorophos]